MARDFWFQGFDPDTVSRSTSVRRRSLESSEFSPGRGDILDSAVRGSWWRAEAVDVLASRRSMNSGTVAHKRKQKDRVIPDVSMGHGRHLRCFLRLPDDGAGA